MRFTVRADKPIVIDFECEDSYLTLAVTDRVVLETTSGCQPSNYDFKRILKVIREVSTEDSLTATWSKRLEFQLKDSDEATRLETLVKACREVTSANCEWLSPAAFRCGASIVPENRVVSLMYLRLCSYEEGHLVVAIRFTHWKGETYLDATTDRVSITFDSHIRPLLPIDFNRVMRLVEALTDTSLSDFVRGYASEWYDSNDTFELLERIIDTCPDKHIYQLEQTDDRIWICFILKTNPSITAIKKACRSIRAHRFEI